MQAIDHKLFIKDINTYIDPFFPVERAIITHGHADHAKSGHKHVLCTRETADIMKIRYGVNCAGSFQIVNYHEEVKFGSYKVTLIPAGHILGSAQVLIETNKEKILVTGDYRTVADNHLRPFELVTCDLLITEATFGLPVFKFRDPREEIDKLLQQMRCNTASVFLLGAYSLGKAQRVINLLRQAGYDEEIFIHGAMEKLCDYYITERINLGRLKKVSKHESKDFNGRLVVAPPSALKDRWSRRFKNITRCYASGWMLIKQRAKQSGVELPLVISDHADWNELTRTIIDTGASEVWLTHGREDALEYWCNKQGIHAAPLSIQNRDEITD